MKLVNQKHKSGCGIACLAMVSGMTYDKILEFMYSNKLKSKKSGFGTFVKSIERTLDVLGIKYSRWVKSGKNRNSFIRWHELEQICQQTEKDAFVGVKTIEQRELGNGGHWVIYHHSNKTILDPEKSKPRKDRRYTIYNYMLIN